jgi:hypothetical protein
MMQSVPSLSFKDIHVDGFHAETESKMLNICSFQRLMDIKSKWLKTPFIAIRFVLYVH